MDFIKKILSFESGNQVFAPSNIAHAFGLLLEGADGETAKEIVSILGHGKTILLLYQFYRILDNVDQSKVSIKHYYDTGNKFDSVRQAANIFLNHKHGLKPDYTSSVLKKFDASVNSINFGESSKAAGTINDWVMNKTDNLIDNLVSADMFNDLTLLALVTAIVFKGNWESKFESLFDANFVSPDGNKQVQFMSLKKKSHFGIYFDNGVGCVRIPYTGGLAMTIIMPDNIQEFESSVTGDKLNYLIDQPFASAGEVTLKMPKFKFGSRVTTQTLHHASYSLFIR